MNDPSAPAASGRPAAPTAAAAAARFAAHALTCRRGERTLFTDIDFRLNDGAMLQIEGANGSGKTSLLRILVGLLHATEGSVRWCGNDIREVRSEFNRNLNFVGHRPGVKAHLTAYENLQVARTTAGARTALDPLRALARVGLQGFEHALVRTLSAGQHRRVALARLLLSDAPLWLLDEPLAALDGAGKETVEHLLDEHLQKGGMAVITTHQPLQLRADAGRLCLG